jgi:large subunit ribosomal protein L23
MNQIIKKPLITEKAMMLAESRQYVFDVNHAANKIQIKQAVEELFEVEVQSIRTANIKGKNKTRFTRNGLMRGRTPNKKKAYVTLKEGYEIELVSGAGGSDE